MAAAHAGAQRRVSLPPCFLGSLLLASALLGGSVTLLLKDGFPFLDHFAPRPEVSLLSVAAEMGDKTARGGSNSHIVEDSEVAATDAHEGSRVSRVLLRDTSRGPWLAEGLSVDGAGALGCRVGELCSFTLGVGAPAAWKVWAKRPLEWDIMAVLEGPALAVAEVEEAPSGLGLEFGLQQGTGTQHPHARNPRVPPLFFQVTYRVWDEGEYTVRLSNPCMTLVLPPHEERLYALDSQLIGSWKLRVLGPEKPKGTKTGTPGTPLAPGLVHASPLPDAFEGACTETVNARWLKSDSPRAAPDTVELHQPLPGAGYAWTPFPCSNWLPLERVLPALKGLGVREVAVVGDSHMRFALLHSIFLLGFYPPYKTYKAHFGFRITLTEAPDISPVTRTTTSTATASAGKGWDMTWEELHADKNPGANRDGSGPYSVSFSFYWVEGVYRAGEFGCYNHNQGDKPGPQVPIQGRPDIAVIDSGAWTAYRCFQPLLAYAPHFQEFVASVVDQLKALECSNILFYGSTPNRSCRVAYNSATNSLISHQRRIQKLIAASYGVRYLNTWEIVGPQYTRTAAPNNSHYTGFAQTELIGVVGAAAAETFLQAIVSLR